VATVMITRDRAGTMALSWHLRDCWRATKVRSTAPKPTEVDSTREGSCRGSTTVHPGWHGICASAQAWKETQSLERNPKLGKKPKAWKETESQPADTIGRGGLPKIPGRALR
jgi:hypothetical protein